MTSYQIHQLKFHVIPQTESNNLFVLLIISYDNLHNLSWFKSQYYRIV